MREAQRARGEKTRYDGRWRPEPGKVLPAPPAGIKPVVRLRNPTDGDVTWNDVVKGPITISNREIDDLIILRPAPEGAESTIRSPLPLRVSLICPEYPRCSECYSMFWTCSRTFSNSLFAAITSEAIRASLALEPMVLISRLIS